MIDTDEVRGMAQADTNPVGFERSMPEHIYGTEPTTTITTGTINLGQVDRDQLLSADDLPHDRMMYVVVHTDREGLHVPERAREQLFATGNLLGFHEVDLWSLQETHIARYIDPHVPHRPFTLILWNVRDRYGIVPRYKDRIVEVLEAKDWNDVHCYLRGLRPEPVTISLPDGESTMINWKRPHGGS